MTAGKDQVLLSLVLPAYNCRQFLRGSLEKAVVYFNKLAWPFEIVCVDDGSTDGTDRIEPPDGSVRILRHDANRGKGRAVRTGMLASKGLVRVFTDADLPYGLDCVALAAYYILLKGYHLVVGDRTLEGSVYHAAVEPLRSFASRVFSFFVGRLITGGFYDTQCGLKAVGGEVADLLFPRLRVNRFAMDVELIYACLINNLDIKRIPVILERNEGSTVRLARDSLRTLADVLLMKYARSRGAYRLPRRPSTHLVPLHTAIEQVEKYISAKED
jgi:glycosyltransferase involved in cell wall biosynthesis